MEQTLWNQCQTTINQAHQQMILIAEDEGRFTKKGALYLKHKYGVCGHEKLQQKQIANKYGVTRMSVNWHQMKAVNALKEAR